MIESAYKIQFLEEKNKALMEHVLELTKIIEDTESNFEAWWYLEGSGIAPIKRGDHDDHAYRISRIAWSKGSFSEKTKNKRDTMENTNTKDKT